MQAITLTREISGATYQPHPEQDCLIGQIPLDESLACLDELNIFYVRQQIPLAECEILLSISSPSSTGVVSTPNYVNQILKHIDCKVTFAYTVSTHI